MAGSGTIATEISTAFDLPFAEVNKAVKACRAARLIQIKGRGSSAAQMTEEDAVVMITALASFGVAADVPATARMLLAMPCRHHVLSGGSEHLRSLYPHHFHDMRDRPFIEGAARLFREQWSPTDEEEGDMFNPLDAPGRLRLQIAVNGRRTQGFAAIHAAARGDLSVKAYYATEPIRADVLATEAPDDLGMGLYQDPPDFVFSTTISGRALAQVGRALARPVRRSRRRKTGLPQEQD